MASYITIPDLVIVTGLSAAGKSVYAAKLAAKHGGTVIHVDMHRYVSGTWIRLPMVEFYAALAATKAAAPTGRIIYDTTYRDASDAEMARIHFVDALLEEGGPTLLISVKASLEDQIVAGQERARRRASGEEPQGAAVETALNRAQWSIKQVRQYDANIQALQDLENKARTQSHVTVLEAWRVGELDGILGL